VDSPLRDEILTSLAGLLKTNDLLRVLKNKRREEEIKEKLHDNKPLEETLKNILKNSPTLSALFLKGIKLSDPFKVKKVKKSEKEFVGNKFPTFFKFKGKPKDKILNRDCHINMKCRVQFDTDAENLYFGRAIKPGEIKAIQITEIGSIEIGHYVGPTLSNGLATLSFDLPKTCKENDILEFEFIVTDETQISPFVNKCRLTVKPEQKNDPKPPKPPVPPDDEKGDDKTLPSGISLPTIRQVKKDEWEEFSPPFLKTTALRAVGLGEEEDQIENKDGGETKKAYDFYINVDNIYLLTELKGQNGEEEVIKSQFMYGLVLVGLAILHSLNDKEESFSGDNGTDVEALVEKFSIALAPFIIPMISTLGMSDLLEQSNGEEVIDEVA